MFYGFIYCAKSPSGKKYYGKSFKSLDNVMRRHYKKSNSFPQRYFYTAIKKYGINNFEWILVEEFHFLDKFILQEKLNEREIFWIKKDKTYLKEYGYNMTLGGDGGDTYSMHHQKREIIEKRIKKLKGQKRTKEQKEKISEIQKSKYKNIDKAILKERAKKANKTKEKRIKQYGYSEKELTAHQKNTEILIAYNKSEEGRKRVSEQWKGKKKPLFSDEHRKNIGKASKGRKIPGRKISVNGVIYESLHESSRLLNIPLTTIQHRLLSKNFNYWYVNE